MVCSRLVGVSRWGCARSSRSAPRRGRWSCVRPYASPVGRAMVSGASQPRGRPLTTIYANGAKCSESTRMGIALTDRHRFECALRLQGNFGPVLFQLALLRLVPFRRAGDIARSNSCSTSTAPPSVLACPIAGSGAVWGSVGRGVHSGFIATDIWNMFGLSYRDPLS